MIALVLFKYAPTFQSPNKKFTPIDQIDRQIDSDDRWKMIPFKNHHPSKTFM